MALLPRPPEREGEWELESPPSLQAPALMAVFRRGNASCSHIQKIPGSKQGPQTSYVCVQYGRIRTVLGGHHRTSWERRGCPCFYAEHCNGLLSRGSVTGPWPSWVFHLTSLRKLLNLAFSVRQEGKSSRLMDLSLLGYGCL